MAHRTALTNACTATFPGLTESNRGMLIAAVQAPDFVMVPSCSPAMVLNVIDHSPFRPFGFGGIEQIHPRAGEYTSTADSTPPP